MDNLQLAITTDIEKEIPQNIIFNYEEIKESLSAALKKYKGMVVTEDGIKDGKATRADLRRLKDALNSARIAAERQWNAPFKVFKTKIDELIQMIDDPTKAIDEQIKAFEEAQREERRATIEAFYKTNIKELRDLLPLERLFDIKWLNKSVNVILATDELFKKIDKARNDMKIIRAMKVECEDTMIDAYLRTLDMGAALAEKVRFEKMQEKLHKVIPGGDSPVPKDAPDVQIAPANPVLATAQETTQITDNTKTIKVIFYDTTPEFRAEMKALTLRHKIQYGGTR